MCGSAAFEVEDVIGYLMEAVAAAGGAVDQLEIATPVDPHGVVATCASRSDPAAR
jgi:hypothetical protein